MKVKGQGNWEFVSENEVESENMADDENYEDGKNDASWTGIDKVIFLSIKSLQWVIILWMSTLRKMIILHKHWLGSVCWDHTLSKWGLFFIGEVEVDIQLINKFMNKNWQLAS